MSWSIVYKVKQNLPQEADIDGMCFEWKLTQKFKFQQRAIVNVNLDFERFPCKDKD
jgi:hypothetical protein